MSESTSYVISVIDGQKYAVTAKNVRSIIELETVTHVPGAPDGVLGVVNLRGDVIPVLEFKDTDSIRENQLVLIIDVQEELDDGNMDEYSIALLIDEVLRVTRGELRAGESEDLMLSHPAVVGMFSLNEEPVMLLDVVRLLPERREVIV